MHHYRYSVRYHCNVGIVPFLCDGHPKRLIHICCYFKSHLFCHFAVLFTHYIDDLVLDQYPDLDLEMVRDAFTEVLAEVARKEEEEQAKAKIGKKATGTTEPSETI